MNRLLLGAVTGTSVLLLAACSGGSGSGSSSTTPQPSSSVAAPTGLGGDGGEQGSTSPRSTVTVTTTPTGTLKTQAAGDQVDGTCPYLPTAIFSQYEGDRIGRVTVSKTEPVDCTFYFDPAWGDGNDIVGEINVETFATPTTALNSVAIAGRRHPEVQQPEGPTIGDGAVLYQTALQGENTWQCVFAKGDTVYTVRTRQSDIALDAANLARAVASRLK